MGRDHGWDDKNDDYDGNRVSYDYDFYLPNCDSNYEDIAEGKSIDSKRVTTQSAYPKCFRLCF